MIEHGATEVHTIFGIEAAWLATTLFLFTYDEPSSGIGTGQAVREGLTTLWKTIRGLFSIANISKLMGYDVMDAEFAAHSVAEVHRQLG